MCAKIGSEAVACHTTISSLSYLLIPLFVGVFAVRLIVVVVQLEQLVVLALEGGSRSSWWLQLVLVNVVSVADPSVQA